MSSPSTVIRTEFFSILRHLMVSVPGFNETLADSPSKGLAVNHRKRSSAAKGDASSFRRVSFGNRPSDRKLASCRL